MAEKQQAAAGGGGGGGATADSADASAAGGAAPNHNAPASLAEYKKSQQRVRELVEKRRTLDRRLVCFPPLRAVPEPLFPLPTLSLSLVVLKEHSSAGLREANTPASLI